MRERLQKIRQARRAYCPKGLSHNQAKVFALLRDRKDRHLPDNLWNIHFYLPELTEYQIRSAVKALASAGLIKVYSFISGGKGYYFPDCRKERRYRRLAQCRPMYMQGNMRRARLMKIRLARRAYVEHHAGARPVGMQKWTKASRLKNRDPYFLRYRMADRNRKRYLPVTRYVRRRSARRNYWLWWDVGNHVYDLMRYMPAGAKAKGLLKAGGQ